MPRLHVSNMQEENTRKRLLCYFVPTALHLYFCYTIFDLHVHFDLDLNIVYLNDLTIFVFYRFRVL